MTFHRRDSECNEGSVSFIPDDFVIVSSANNLFLIFIFQFRLDNNILFQISLVERDSECNEESVFFTPYEIVIVSKANNLFHQFLEPFVLHNPFPFQDLRSTHSISINPSLSISLSPALPILHLLNLTSTQTIPFASLSSEFLRTSFEIFRTRSGKSPQKVRRRSGEGPNLSSIPSDYG